MTTPEDRLSRLEGAYEHLATKADVQALETRMTQQITASEARMTKQIAESETRIVKWVVGVMIGGIIAGAAIATAIANLVG